MQHKVINIEVDGCTATLTTYLLDNSKEMDINRKRPMILICPGGGYSFVSSREAEPIAIQMLAMGFHAAILRYSVAPAKFPTALVQLSKAVAYIRDNHEEMNVLKDKIIVAGFSAGGHLAASLGTFWHEQFLNDIMGVSQEQYKPNGLILSYPVITSGEFAHRGSFQSLLPDNKEELLDKVSLEKQVSEHTPPTFLWHTFEDGSVPVENSLLFASALRKCNVPFELHIYPRGGHGLALANEETMSASGNGVQQECTTWISLAGTWVRNL